jgi:hypothetical protein
MLYNADRSILAIATIASYVHEVSSNEDNGCEFQDVFASNYSGSTLLSD